MQHRADTQHHGVAGDAASRPWRSLDACTLCTSGRFDTQSSCHPRCRMLREWVLRFLVVDAKYRQLMTDTDKQQPWPSAEERLLLVSACHT
jgi:hypothetical protein